MPRVIRLDLQLLLQVLSDIFMFLCSRQVVVDDRVLEDLVDSTHSISVTQMRYLGNNNGFPLVGQLCYSFQVHWTFRDPSRCLANLLCDSVV